MTRRALILALAIIATGGVVFFTTYPSADAILLEGTFTDDNDSVHQNGIEAVAAAGITLGCNPPANDRYCPTDNVSRAQSATFVARALDLPATNEDFFTDDDGHVLEGGINKVAEAGITVGCNPPANDRFCPNRSLTRAQFATFMVRALDIDHTSTDHFVDDDSSVHERGINALAEAGITVGCNPPANDRYCPNETLTRGQMATLFTRALELPHAPQRVPLTNWNPISCSKDGVRCSVSIETFAGRSHLIEEGLFQAVPYRPGEQAEFLGDDTEFRLTLDGSPVALFEKDMTNNGSKVTRMWNTTLVFSNGNHVLVGEWYRGGVLIQRTTANLDVG